MDFRYEMGVELGLFRKIHCMGYECGIMASIL